MATSKCIWACRYGEGDLLSFKLSICMGETDVLSDFADLLGCSHTTISWDYRVICKKIKYAVSGGSLDVDARGQRRSTE